MTADLVRMVRSMRPGNVAMAGIAVWTGAVLASGEILPSKFSVYASSAAAALLLGFANMINDIEDEDLDRSKPGRRDEKPLDWRTYRAFAVLLILASGSFMLGGIVVEGNVLPGIVYCFAVPSVLLYEFGLKKEGLAGNAMVGMLVGATFLLGGVHYEMGILVLILSVMAALATVSREIVKDIEDMDNDLGFRDSLPIRSGAPFSSGIASFLSLIAVSLSFYPVFSKETNVSYVVLILLADTALIVSAIRSGKSPQDAAVSQGTMKAAMALTILGFLSLIVI